MPVLSSAVSALSTFYQDSLDPFDPTQVEISTIRLLAKLPTIASYAYKKSIGQPFLYPDNSLGLRGELPAHDLRRARPPPTRSTRCSPGCSTCCSCCTPTTSRTARPRPYGWSAPPTPNLFASVSAGVNALFGPLHGGANQAVLEMLERHPGRRRRRRRRSCAG